MDASLFLEQFGHLAESPGGVSKLRNLILELAVRGRLVPQDPDDEPASDLLRRIEAEKKRLIKAGEIKPSKPLPPIREDEVPYALADGWVWSRLEAIGEINPRNDLDDDLPVSFVPMTLISEQYQMLPEMEERAWGDIRKGYTHFAEGDVAIAKITPCFQNGKACVMRNLINGFGAGTTELHVFRDVTRQLFADYIYIFLKSPHFVDNGIALMTGTAGQQRVPKDYFAFTPFPLPPLAEQERIVAKVDELMALCDQLEAEQAERDHLRERATKSTLHHLTDAPTRAEARRYWDYAEQHFPHLFDHSATVADLRATILQLAVQGRLVPQNPDDEPADVLLKRIEAEKKRLYEKGQSKKSVELRTVAEEDILGELPSGWTYVFIDSLLSLDRQGMKTGPFGSLLKKHEHQSNGVPVFGIENIGRMEFIHGNKIFVTQEKAHELRGYEVMPGDVLISRSGTVGEVCVVPEGYTWALISTNLMRIVLNKNIVEPRFFMFLFNGSSHVLEQVSDLCRGTTREFLNQKILSAIVFPLPPLAEQQRIVAKVDELMALCDQLEAAADARQALSGRLFDSVVHHLFAPSVVS